MRARPGFIHFLQRVGVSALAVLVVVLSLELIVRIVRRLSPPERAETRSVDFITCDRDSLLGWIFPASSQGLFQTGPHPTPLETNELGLRNPPIDVGREPCLRIIVLGDSYAFGWGVQKNEAFPRQLEAMIVERYPRVSVEVVNAGYPGMGSTNSAPCSSACFPMLSLTSSSPRSASRTTLLTISASCDSRPTVSRTTHRN